MSCTFRVSSTSTILIIPVPALQVLMTRPAEDYSTSTSFAVWTTEGHAQIVSHDVAVYTADDEYYSKTVYTTNSTRTYSHNNFFGNVECEINGENKNGVLVCLEKEDKVFVLDTARMDRNPKYLNLYTVKKLYVHSNRTRDYSFDRFDGRDGTMRNRIQLDSAISTRFENVNNTYATRIFKFVPPQHPYPLVSTCSNRGLCEPFSGVCECFHSYTGDACQTLDVMAPDR